MDAFDLFMWFFVIMLCLCAVCAIASFLRMGRKKENQWQEADRQEEKQREIAYSRYQMQQQAEKERKERASKLSQHQQFVSEQRCLMTDSMRYDVLRRDGFRCQLCGASAQDGARLHVDHIFPVSKGGKTEPSNLRTLCEQCNMGKRDKIEAVPQDQTPLSGEEARLMFDRLFEAKYGKCEK